MKYEFCAGLATAIAFPLLLSAGPASAAKYVGIELCGTSTEQSLTESMTKAGMTPFPGDRDAMMPMARYMEANDFLILDKPRNITVLLYKGRVAEISVRKADDLRTTLTAKYGNPIASRESSDQFSVHSIDILKIASDPVASLWLRRTSLQSAREFTLTSAVRRSVLYLCRGR